MAQYGKVILKYRRINNLTQGQLAEKLFVSPQAISKWEKNQSEPDLATIKKIVDIFGITIEEFFNEEEKIEDINLEEKNEENLLTCEICGQEFSEEDIISTDPYNICKSCQVELLEEEKFFDNFDESKVSPLKFNALAGKKSFIAGGVVAGLMIILGIITGLSNNPLTFIEGLLLGIGLAVLVGTFITQMLYDSWLRDFFAEFLAFSVRMPGIIFELSIDGIVWLIGVKILFALISLTISAIAAGFGLFLSFIIAPFTYIYELVTKIKGGFDND